MEVRIKLAGRIKKDGKRYAAGSWIGIDASELGYFERNGLVEAKEHICTEDIIQYNAKDALLKIQEIEGVSGIAVMDAWLQQEQASQNPRKTIINALETKLKDVLETKLKKLIPETPIPGGDPDADG